MEEKCYTEIQARFCECEYESGNQENRHEGQGCRGAPMLFLLLWSQNILESRRF